MAWAWKQDLKAPEKLILLALSDHADDQGMCWPGLRGISKKCGLSRRAVISNLNNLINKGLVKKEPRFDDAGNNRSNYYYLTTEGGAPYTPPSAPAALPPVNVAHQGSVSGSPPLVHLVHPESSIRNIKEKNIPTVPDELKKKFDLFWSVYPKKAAKVDAIRAFNKLNPSDDLLSTIMAALNRFAESPDWQTDDGKYVPHPATWLNKRRWEDEDGIDRYDPAKGAI